MSFTPNPECPWVTAENSDTTKVLSVGYVNADLSGGNLGIYVYALRAKIFQWGIPYHLNLPGSVDTFGTRPEFHIDMQGGGFNPEFGVGPFEIELGGAKVKGMGLPLNRHVIYVVTFSMNKSPLT